GPVLRGRPARPAVPRAAARVRADRRAAVRAREVRGVLRHPPRPPRRGGARVLRHADRARRRAQEGGGAVPGARGRAVHRAVLEADRRLASRRAGAAVKTVGRWRSERLGREVTLVRWGTYGQPVLLFPTAGGDAEEVERMHLIGACNPLLEAGKIKLYSCDSVA